MMAEDTLEELQEKIESLEELASEVQALESSVESDIQDVRERVVQVKREADTKAPRDHGHERLEGKLAELESETEATREALERTDSRMEGGFENFEEILESLLDRTKTLESDLDTLGQALKSIRQTLDTVAAREQRRARADHLKASAADSGVRTAKCEACRSTIDIALLSDATCPSCGETFHTLDANPGFFGTSILETGDRPALEGETTASRPDLNSIGTEAGTDSEDAKTAFNWQKTDTEGDSS